MRLNLDIELEAISISELMRELLQTHDADMLVDVNAEAVTDAKDDRLLDAWAKKRLEP